MEKPRYPQWALREKILWAVHEWCEDRTDTRKPLHYSELVAMVEDEVYQGTPTATGIELDRQAVERAQAHVLNTFLTLVTESYIDAEPRGGYKGGPPFTHAFVRGLGDKGLIAIQELPDRITESLDAIAEAIRALPDVPAEEKKSAIDAAKELKTFLRGLSPTVAIELFKAIARALSS